MSVFVVHNFKSLSAGFISIYDSNKNTVHFLKTAWEYHKSRQEIGSDGRTLIPGAFSNMTLRVQPVWG